MKTRILVGVLLLVGIALAYQVYHYVEVAQQASKPVDPSQRFAVSSGAPTEDEIQREEKRLELQLQKDRAETLARSQASAAQAPAAQTPVSQTPAAQAPAAQTPVSQTPAAQAPAAQTPVSQTPVSQTPAAAPAHK